MKLKVSQAKHDELKARMDSLRVGDYIGCMKYFLACYEYMDCLEFDDEDDDNSDAMFESESRSEAFAMGGMDGYNGL
jgi:hypothetical protein